MNHTRYATAITKVNKGLINVLVLVMTIALILSLVQLIFYISRVVIEPPYPFMLDVNELFEVFKLCLIIAVGYELIKSLLIIVGSEVIPVVPIVKIALIAIANKIITLDLHTTEALTIVGMALLVMALALCLFFLSPKPEAADEK